MKKIIKFCNLNKHFFVAGICLIMMIMFLAWTTFDGVTNYVPSGENNKNVNYKALRENLSSYYFIFFMTDQTSFLFLTCGILYFFFHKKNFFNSIFFCFIAYLVFNIFALTSYDWSTFSKLPYSTFKTMMCHLVFPLTGWGILLWIRKDIVLTIKPLFVCSFYLTIFYLITLIVYYSVTYEENNQVYHLTIYEFLDFNNRVIIFPTQQMVWRVIVNLLIILISPFASLVVFFIFKFIFVVKYQKTLKLNFQKVQNKTT